MCTSPALLADTILRAIRSVNSRSDQIVLMHNSRKERCGANGFCKSRIRKTGTGIMPRFATAAMPFHRRKAAAGKESDGMAPDNSGIFHLYQWLYPY